MYKERNHMTALLIILTALVLLGLGYRLYGSWLEKEWGVDPKKATPAITKKDGIDYVAAKPVVLMGHHFPPSRAQARSTARSRLPSSDGSPFSYGASSAAFSSAAFRISAPCSHRSDTAASLSVRSSRIPWASARRSCSSSSRCSF